VSGVERLLEREQERERITELVESCAGGAGRLLFVEGPAGIGKTTLLDETRALAASSGMMRLSARGGLLEQGFGFGVVRQLFERLLREAAPRDRRALLAGAAGLSAAIVAPDLATVGPLVGADRTFAVMHGLFWLTVNLAERAPLLIVVDDAHWCDPPSLHFVAYLARRLEGLGVLIALGVRSGEPNVETEVLRTLAREPVTSVLQVAALRADAVARQLERAGMPAPDERFVRACHRATAGNPLLLKELIHALIEQRVAPTAAAATEVATMALSSVGVGAMAQLSRLPPAVTTFARAAAVLGEAAEMRHVAWLAGLGERSAAEAIDALVAVSLMTSGDTVDFAHPIVRESIYAALPPGVRSSAHRRAAGLFAELEGDVERAGTHLLANVPNGDVLAVEWLRAAASTALGHGAPATAVGYLRRALNEPPPIADRAAVLYELGCAEAMIREPAAIASLEQALELSRDPTLRARVAGELGWLLTSSGRWNDSVALIETAVRELGPGRRDLALPLEWMRAAASVYTPGLADRVPGELSRWHALARAGGARGRGLLLLLGAVTATRSGQRDETLRLVDAGLDGGRLLADEGAASLSLPQAFAALAYIDEVERLDVLAELALEDARQRGSVFGLVTGLAYRGLAAVQRGALPAAETDLLGALAIAQEHEALFAIPTILRYLGEPLVERTGLDSARQMVGGLTLEPAFMATYSGSLLGGVRAMLAAQRGDRAAAAQGLRGCLATEDALGMRNPALFLTRSTLALALGPSDREEAMSLVSEELALAREMGLARAEGVALRATGVLAGGSEGIELLREAVDALDRCPSELEQARGRCELGGALRRGGWRREAREPLARSLESARRCGASRLADRAEEELRAAGARPRRWAFSGRDALTVSERRVADLAAADRSNREIAETLFVTPKTVENHLGRVYAKLDIHSRAELRSALSDEGTVAEQA
jgi:DNA-binding CsgD family transcriptional regulator